MAGGDTEVRIVLSADTRQFISDLNRAAKATDGVTVATDKVAAKSKRSTESMRLLGLGALAAGGLVTAGLIKAANAAGDFNESTSKMKTIFGNASADITKFADDAAQKLGMSSKAATDAASTMATFGKAAGLTGKDLSKFSTDMVQLSGDLASFYNTSPEDAAAAIGAALRGESEPIRNYGVLLDDATLKQRALKDGITDTIKGSLTPQQKALAAQAEILAQTTDAQGDFARTSGGLANSQRQFTAELEDLQAEVGQTLVPILTKGTKGATALVGAVGKLPGPVKDGAALLAGLFAVASIGAPAVSGAVKGLTAVRDGIAAIKTTAVGAKIGAALSPIGNAVKGMGGMAGAATGMLGPIGLAAVAVGGLAVAAKKFSDAEAAKHAQRLATEFENARIAGNHLDSVLKVVVSRTSGPSSQSTYGAQFEVSAKVITGLQDVLDITKQTGVPAKEAADQLRVMGQSLASMSPEAAAVEWKYLKSEVGNSKEAVDRMLTVMPEWAAKLKDSKVAAADAALAQQDLAKATQDATKAAEEAKTALFNYINAQLAAEGSADALIGAGDRLAKSLKDNVDAHRKHAGAVAGNSEAARKNREALRQEAAAIATNAQAVYDKARADGKTAPEALERSRKAIIKGRDALIEQAKQAGLTEKDVEAYVAKLLKVPKRTNTEMKADISVLEAKLATAKNKLNDPKLTDPEKSKIRATIADLEAKVAAARRRLDGIPKEKKVTISAHGTTLDTTADKAAKLLGTLNKINGMHARFSVGGGGMGGLGGLDLTGGRGLMAATHGVGHPGAQFGARGPRWSTDRRNGMGMHDGSDIGAPRGTPIYATRSGWVSHSSGGWAGNHATLRVGNLQLIYAHMSRFGKSGLVNPGDILGYVGSTGNSTGNHLHIQARVGGRLVNPSGRLWRGGPVRGPGTSTSDSIPALLSDGEYVVRASAVDYWGEDYLDGINAYAKGGKASKKGKKKSKAPSVSDIVDDAGWQEQMGMIDLPAKLAILQGQLGRLKQGSSQWKDLSLSIKQLRDDIDAEAGASAYQQAMSAFEHAVNMGQQGYTTAAEQLAQLNNVVATTTEEEWALAEKKHALEMDIVNAQRQAAAEAEAALQAQRDARDQQASSIASGMIQSLGLGQTTAAGKKWGAGSMLGDFAQRAAKASDFASMVQQLTSRGLSEDVINQVVSAGPEAGRDMARALMSMSTDQLASVNESQNQIRSAAAGMGGFLANAFYGVAGAGGTMKIELGGGSPVVLQLDSRQVYEGQLELRRQMGGGYALVGR